MVFESLDWKICYTCMKNLYEPIEDEKARFANLDDKKWT